jgi:uncharacterized hydrophobic protein (TIGR00341 family)
MKKILVHARDEDYDALVNTLEGLYYVTDHVGDVNEFILFAPDDDVNDLVEKIREALDLRYNENMIEVSKPEFVVSTYLQRAEKKAEAKEENTPVEKLLSSVKPYTKLDLEKVALTSIAGLVALFGLFLNNSVIIIGAMLLSPIIGPIYSFSVNIALGKAGDALRSVGVLLALLGAVFLLSAIATFAINPFILLPITDEIAGRIVTNPSYIIMAVLLGFAAVLAYTLETPEIIAGVAIAAALLPPVVVSGIVLVLRPVSILSAAVLVVDEIVGLMAGALLAVLMLKIGPRDSGEQIAARKYIFRSAAILAVFIAFLIAITLFVGPNGSLV